MDDESEPETGPIFQEAKPGTIVSPPPQPPQRPQWGLWTAAAILLLLAGILGVWFIYTLNVRSQDLYDRLADDAKTIDHLTSELSRSNANAKNLYDQLDGATRPAGPVCPDNYTATSVWLRYSTTPDGTLTRQPVLICLPNP